MTKPLHFFSFLFPSLCICIYPMSSAVDKLCSSLQIWSHSIEFVPKAHFCVPDLLTKWIILSTDLKYVLRFLGRSSATRSSTYFHEILIQFIWSNFQHIYQNMSHRYGDLSQQNTWHTHTHKQTYQQTDIDRQTDRQIDTHIHRPTHR